MDPVSHGYLEMEEKGSERCGLRIAAEELRDGPIYVYGKGNGYVTAKSFIFDRINDNEIIITDCRFEKDRRITDRETELTIESFVSAVKRDKARVIITVGSRRIYDEVQTDLKSRGVTELVSAKSFYEFHLSYNANTTVMDCVAEIVEHSPDIECLKESLADKKSKEVLSQLISLYCNKRSTIDCEPLTDQYLPRDIELEIDFRCYLCAGAYDGDTVKSVIESGARIGKLVCFEPDVINFQKLTRSVLMLGARMIEEPILYPSLLSGRTEIKTFRSSGSTNSTCTSVNTGLSQVACAVDDVMPSLCPTYITMDIEGSELDALSGMERMLKRHKPVMGIAVYHRISDLWEIHRALKGYGYSKFFLRNYSGGAAETIMYCC